VANRLAFGARAATAFLAGAVLLGSLLVILPRPAEATQVLVSPASVGAPTIDGGDYVFDVLVTVTIPAGEHAPLSFAEVLVTPHSGGATCDARSDAHTNPRVEVGRFDGGVATYGRFNATVHAPVSTGTGYSLNETGMGVDFGYGYGYEYGNGYGRADQPTTLNVPLRVRGCLSHASFPGSPQKSFDVAVLFGPSTPVPAGLFPSVPFTVVLMDPAFVAPTNPTDDPAVAVAGVSQGGGQEGVSFLLTDGHGEFAPVAAGATLGPFSFPAELGSSAAVSFSLTAVEQLPAGTQVLFTFQDQGVTQDALHPPFDIDSAILGGQLHGKDPAFFTEIRLSVPGQGFVPATGRIALHVTFHVAAAYFTATHTRVLGLTAFNGTTGALENGQPHRIGAAPPTGDQDVTFNITAFSAFVGHGLPLGGGGGGSGSSAGGNVPVAPPVAPPVTPPVTPVVPPPVNPPEASRGTTTPAPTPGGQGATLQPMLLTLGILVLIVLAAVGLLRRMRKT